MQKPDRNGHFLHDGFNQSGKLRGRRQSRTSEEKKSRRTIAFQGLCWAGTVVEGGRRRFLEEEKKEEEKEVVENGKCRLMLSRGLMIAVLRLLKYTPRGPTHLACP